MNDQFLLMPPEAQDGCAEMSLADEQALRRGDTATLVPPRDVHSHGHVTGTGTELLFAHSPG